MILKPKWPEQTRSDPNGTISIIFLTGVIVMGGDSMSAYVPEAGIQEILRDNNDAPIWKLRYNT